jgi:hypothetical protein
MMTKTEVRRFQTKDDGGNRHTIIEYTTFEESDEIRADRMRTDPIIGQCFEPVHGGAVIQITEDTFQILSTNKIVRKV